MYRKFLYAIAILGGFIGLGRFTQNTLDKFKAYRRRSALLMSYIGILDVQSEDRIWTGVQLYEMVYHAYPGISETDVNNILHDLQWQKTIQVAADPTGENDPLEMSWILTQKGMTQISAGLLQVRESVMT